MKTKLFTLIAALALALTTGCKNTNANVGPPLLRLGVSTSAGYAIMRYPQAIPGVRAGKDIICAAANGTNISPASIVAALDAYDAKTPESVLILNAAITAYSIAYNSLSNTNDANPYALAVCEGLNDALLMPSPLKAGRRELPAHKAKWPQVRYP